MFKNLPFALITSSIFSNNFNKVFAIFPVPLQALLHKT